MLKLAVCDDEIQSRETLLGYAQRLRLARGRPCLFESFSTAESLLASPRDFDILLLDVELGSMNGISTAKTLREEGCEAVIILVTNYIQYAIEGYEVQAFQFLKKPVQYERFARVVGKALDALEQRKNASLTIRGDDSAVNIPVSQIQYCETDRGRVLIHTPQGVIRCFSTMAQLEAQLGAMDFYRCHSAFLVNLASIERFTVSQLRLKDGSLIPISKHRKKGFKEALARYWGGAIL